jgi:tetratricopeptide (TPR) repeat protein
MIAWMVRAAGVLLALAAAGVEGAPGTNEALSCFYAASPDSAIRHCTAAINAGGLSDAGLAVVFGRRCRAYGRKQDYARALPDCERAVKLAPNSALQIYRRGVARWHSGDLDRSMSDFEEANRLDPNLALAYGERGYIYAERRQYDEAIRDYGAALRLKPDARLYLDRGLCYFEKGSDDLAERDYTEAIRLAAGAQGYYFRSFCYSRNFDSARALADLNEAIRLAPKYADAYGARARLHDRRGEYDQAIRDYDEALRLHPEARGYEGRGWANYHKGAYLAALRDFAMGWWRFWVPILVVAGLLYFLSKRRKAAPQPPPEPDPEEEPEQPAEAAEDAAPEPEPVPEWPDNADLDTVIRTGLRDPVVIVEAERALRGASIPFFALDESAAVRYASGNAMGWWDVRVPHEREAEAREILKDIEQHAHS